MVWGVNYRISDRVTGRMEWADAEQGLNEVMAQISLKGKKGISVIFVLIEALR